MKVRKTMCDTCPFREGAMLEHLRPYLTGASLESSRICHQTGSNNAIHHTTGKRSQICRGSRDFQLGIFYALGFLDAPTDKEWDRKWEQIESKRERKIHGKRSKRKSKNN